MVEGGSNGVALGGGDLGGFLGEGEVGVIGQEADGVDRGLIPLLHNTD